VSGFEGLGEASEIVEVPRTYKGCSRQIVIIVAPDTRAGRYRAYVEFEQEPLCESRQPFLDGARELLLRGHSPQTILVMRWGSRDEWALRNPLGIAAELTVDEHNGTFASWKPYSRSAVPSEDLRKLANASRADMKLSRDAQSPEDVMTFLISARTLYRDYLIELQQSDQGWRVLRVAHCLGGAKSFFPALVYHCDRVAAEEEGRR